MNRAEIRQKFSALDLYQPDLHLICTLSKKQMDRKRTLLHRLCHTSETQHPPVPSPPVFLARDRDTTTRLPRRDCRLSADTTVRRSPGAARGGRGRAGLGSAA